MHFLIEIRRLLDNLRTQGLRLTLISGVDKLLRWITGRPSYRFGWITPSILLGGQPALSVWPRLIARGITGVVNLRKEYDYANGISALSLRYLYLPTIDNKAPSQEHLWAGVRFMEEEIRRGGKVYIHCWEGLGRSPTLVAAYLVNNGMTPKEAWDAILKVRPFIRPTQLQRDRLDEFAAEIIANPAPLGSTPPPPESVPAVSSSGQPLPQIPLPDEEGLKQTALAPLRPDVRAEGADS
jgi:dual specificity MAP kinase phosphatase